MNSIPIEYIIDKTYIYKDISGEIKDLLKENERIKLVISPKYVPKAFQIAKELNEEGIASYDEELKIERNIIDKKYKTKIYLSIKRKPKIFILRDNNQFNSPFEQIKNYLKHHDKVIISAKSEEVSTAFKLAKELVRQGIALYDEELKISRNFKSKNGKTQVNISLKRKQGKNLIKNNSDLENKLEKIQNDNELVSSDKLENKTKNNNQNLKQLNKEYEIGKKFTYEKVLKDIRELLKENYKIKIITLKNKIGIVFDAIKVLYKEGIAEYYEELNVERNFKKGEAKAFISIKKKLKISN